MTADQLILAALALPAEERVRIIQHLVESLSPPEEADEAVPDWITKTSEQMADFVTGKVDTISTDALVAELIKPADR